LILRQCRIEWQRTEKTSGNTVARPPRQNAQLAFGSRMLKFSGPSVAPGPKWTAWTLLTLWIIFSFLVGTADNPIGKNNSLGAMAADEG
jgi:hypothetical protein